MKYRVEVEMRTVTCAYAEVIVEADSKQAAKDKAEGFDQFDLDFGPDSYPDIEYNIIDVKENV